MVQMRQAVCVGVKHGLMRLDMTKQSIRENMGKWK